MSAVALALLALVLVIAVVAVIARQRARVEARVEAPATAIEIPEGIHAIEGAHPADHRCRSCSCTGCSASIKSGCRA